MTRWQTWAAVAVAVLAAGSTQAQGQRQPGGGRGQQQTSLHVLALTNEDLQKELKITDDQKKGLKELTDKAADLAKKRAEAMSGGQPDRTKLQELQTESTKLAEEAKTGVEKALTDEQKKRLGQIDVQRMGMAAFTNEKVVNAMKFTDEQKAKMKTAAEEYTKASTELRTEYGLGGRGGQGGQQVSEEKRAEYNKKAAALTTETMDKVKKELTDEQKKAWEEMTGAAFDVSKLQARPMRRDN
jgi:hypothetical protein